MKIRRVLLGFVQLGAVFFLTNCMGGSAAVTNTSSSPVYITLTPKPLTVPAGGTVVFSSIQSGPVTYGPVWALTTGSSAGTLSSTTGSTVTYNAPVAPPIYVGESTSFQGMVTVQVQVENTAGCNDATDSATFAITGPSIQTGISPQTLSLALGSTQYFTGYAVGSADNQVVWQVNGVTGGSVQTGIINTLGLYVAPANLPVTGANVTITLISVADPSKSSSAVVTLH